MKRSPRKALPAAITSGPDRPARVQREAEPLAALEAERVWAVVPASIEGSPPATHLPDTPGTAAHFIRRFLPE